MFEILKFEFVQHAVIIGFFASIICGIIGTLVVVNRLVFISGSIAHAAYGGIGISLFFGFSYYLGIIFFSVISALIMGVIIIKQKHRADLFIGVLWAFGMALGIFFIDLSPGYNVDLMSYLFGSILAVLKQDLYIAGFLTLFIIAGVICYYKEFLAMSYDSEFAEIRGINVKFLNIVLLFMIAVSVVVLIKIVGLILVIALITIPPYIAEKYSNSLIFMMIISFILSFFFIIIGLIIAYNFNISSSASIILLASLCFFISFLIKKEKVIIKK